MEISPKLNSKLRAREIPTSATAMARVCSSDSGFTLVMVAVWELGSYCTNWLLFAKFCRSWSACALSAGVAALATASCNVISRVNSLFRVSTVWASR